MILWVFYKSNMYECHLLNTSVEMWVVIIDWRKITLKKPTKSDLKPRQKQNKTINTGAGQTSLDNLENCILSIPARICVPTLTPSLNSALAVAFRWAAVQSEFAVMDATEQLSDHRGFLVETLIFHQYWMEYPSRLYVFVNSKDNLARSLGC